MSNNFYKTYHGYILSFILYLSLIFGFYFDENLNFGAIPDWLYTDLPVINDLSHNIKKTLLNYEVYERFRQFASDLQLLYQHLL